jgi:hypothetical protein
MSFYLIMCPAADRLARDLRSPRVSKCEDHVGPATIRLQPHNTHYRQA